MAHIPNQTNMPSEQIAKIEETECIGCTRCIKACPVDAIIGAENLLHHILKDVCIGCELCLPPCPVDCITMVDYQHPQPKAQRVQQAKQRIHTRKTRLAKQKNDSHLQSQQRKLAIQNIPTDTSQASIKRLEIQIKKAEKALQNASPDKRNYAEQMLRQLYQKQNNWYHKV